MSKQYKKKSNKILPLEKKNERRGSRNIITT